MLILVMTNKYATTREILRFAAIGAYIAGTLIAPQLPRVLNNKTFDFDNFLKEGELEGFNKSRLKQKIKELHKQKSIRIYQVGDKYIMQLTNKGRKRMLKYNLEDLQVPKQEKWDEKWRIVAYDIPEDKKPGREALRTTLKRLGFYELQKSLYLYPYPCSDIIEFIREFYEIGEYVDLITVGYLENQEAYKKYFEL